MFNDAHIWHNQPWNITVYNRKQVTYCLDLCWFDDIDFTIFLN